MYVEILGKENVILPQKGDAGIDLIAESEPIFHYTESGEAVRFIEYSTNVRTAPSSENVHGFIFPRSSISNYDLTLCNSVAVIDSSYRGEIKLRFRKTTTNLAKIYKKGDKIGQLMFFSPCSPDIVFVNEFKTNSTLRAEGGFGSTGE